MHTLQQLYDSEINWKIDTFWDAGFFWGLSLPDAEGRYRAEGSTDSFEDAVFALAAAAAEHFPDSVFARRVPEPKPDEEQGPEPPYDGP